LTLGLTHLRPKQGPRKMKTRLTKKSQTAISAILLLALSLGASPLLASASAAPSFNNVQIFVTTSSSLSYSYTFTAYNLTGSLMGTYQSSFPAAGFELPTGDYLFTVSALHETSYPYPCVACATPANGAGESVPPVKNGSGSSGTAIVYYPPASEYGFLQAHVDGPKTLTIATKNVTTYPTSQLAVKVSYVNGTAASGAQISASVVGQWSYWWGQDSKVNMWSQTGNDGTATLTVPDAPLVVTAWAWLPVSLPPDNKTVVTTVGGEKVNVTVYWEPTYVGLSASALVVPPFGVTNLTLHYQQPIYWAVPAGTVSSGSAGQGSSGATMASKPTGVPADVMQTKSAQTGQAQVYTPSQIPAIQGIQQPSQGGEVASASWPLWALAIAGVAVVVGISAVLALRRKNGPHEAPV